MSKLEPSSKPRLCVVITAMTYGGAQRILTDSLPSLVEEFEIEVLCLYPGPMAALLREAGIAVKEFDYRGLRTILSVRHLAAEMKRFRPDIVHTHLGKADFCGRLAARLAGVRHIVTTSHNSEHWKLNPMLNAIDNLSLRLADKVIAVSGEVADFLVSRGLPREKIVVSYARAELRRRFAVAHLSESRRRELRASLLLPKDALVSIMVGRMHRQKAHEVALEALAQIGPLPRPHVLLMAGEGPLRAGHQELARKLCLEHQVRFLGNRGDVADLLRISDVFVMPSRWEGAPLALMEAHGAGLPAVVSDIPSMSEVVANCGGALVAKVDDPASLAARWRTLLLDEPLRERLGEQARRKALENWDITKLVEEYAAVYRSLVSGVSSPPPA